MTVALPTVAMRLSELTILYLAAAAPFGVAHYASRRGGGGLHARALLKSTAAALAWPVMVTLLLLRRSREAESGGAHDAAQAPDERRVEGAKRATVNALRKVEDVCEEAGASEGEAERHAFFAARECVERYTGLALACAASSSDAGPSHREMELCRIAGRAGDDLLVAGRCAHRRNVTRLVAHRERARSELVHALAGVRELTFALEGAAAGRASEALLGALARAIELLSLFDDRETVVRAARLLDAECARLRRLGGEAGAFEAAPLAGRQEGGVGCTTQAEATAFATTLRRTTTRASASTG
ncbi:MAG TPA: hypothetical protein VD968_03765 [Pyrinomonadaceae bacterium]|nr:hypothetical protein [Pyrinomonadaceae bacterium]